MKKPVSHIEGLGQCGDGIWCVKKPLGNINNQESLNNYIII